MKKIISLLLALALLSLCACGSSDNSNTTNQSDDSVSSNSDLANVLTTGYDSFGDWKPLYSPNTRRGLGFFKPDAVELAGSFIKCDWTLEGSTVIGTLEDGSTVSYDLKELNGVYYLVNDLEILYNPALIEYNNIPCNAIELTLDNWQEYFEVVYESEEIIDQFGESTGEIREHYYLTVKEEYHRTLLLERSEILIRYEQGSPVPGVYDDQIFASRERIEIKNPDEFPLEMLKIQGTLYFMDGL